jgi:hypothetical protein
MRFALRQLLKNPGFTAVAVSSLAVGLALAATTFSLVNAYLLRSLPYPTAERVHHVRYAPPGPYEPQGMTAIDWKSLDDVVEDTITPASATFYVITPLSARVRNYMIRLREGVPVAYAERRITEAARAVGSGFRPDWAGVQLESVHDRYVAEIRPVLLGVSAAVGIVLVLVCANVGVHCH